MKTTTRWPRAAFAVPIVLAVLAIPAAALAHIERPAYWPDPAPDTSVNPAAALMVRRLIVGRSL